MRRLLPGLRANAADRQYGLSRRVLNLERAPARIPATQVRPVIKRAPAMATPDVPSFLYALGNTNWYLHGSWLERAAAFGSSQPRAYNDEVASINFDVGEMAISLDGAVTFDTKATPEDPGDLWRAPWGDYWFLSNDTGSAFRSLNQGDTWSAALLDGTDYGIIAFGFGATDQVAVGVIDHTDTGKFKVGISTDNGDSFTFSTLENAAEGGAAVSLFYTSAGIVALYLRNNGANKEVIARIYNGSWGSRNVLLSIDAGDITSLYSVASQDIIYAVPYGVLDGSVYTSVDGGTVFTALAAPESGGSFNGAAAIDRGRDDDFYADFIDSLSDLRLFRWRNAGWTEDTLPDPTSFYLAGG